eukprot:13755104-Alexandrium_andersonii.AAC.1
MLVGRQHEAGARRRFSAGQQELRAGDVQSTRVQQGHRLAGGQGQANGSTAGHGTGRGGGGRRPAHALGHLSPAWESVPG